MENWLYFRATSVANDDGIAASSEIFTSICIPASNVVDIHPVSDTQLEIQIKDVRLKPALAGEDTNTAHDDYVRLTITQGKAFEIMKAFMEAITGAGKNGFIVIGDDATGEYLHPNITAVGDIVSRATATGNGYHTMSVLSKIDAGGDAASTTAGEAGQAVATIPFYLKSGSIIKDANIKALSGNLSDIGTASVNLKYHTAVVADNAATAGYELLGTEASSVPGANNLCIPNDNLNIGASDDAERIINFGSQPPIALTANTYFHLNATEDMSSATDSEAFVITTIKWFGKPATIFEIA